MVSLFCALSTAQNGGYMACQVACDAAGKSCGRPARMGWRVSRTRSRSRMGAVVRTCVVLGDMEARKDMPHLNNNQ